jgi:hypothetical protein
MHRRHDRAGAAMMNWRPELAAISDISTNIFAVFILILVIMLDLSRGPTPSGGTAATPTQVDAARDLRIVERAPLRAGEMVEMLRGHGGRDTVTVDLFDSRIEIAAAGGRPAIVLDARRDGGRAMLERFEELLRGRPAGMPARLYVFSNRWYSPVADRLERGNASWREMSVPLALRIASGPEAGDAWSEAFLELSSRGLDRERFRPALARLLAGSADGAGGAGGLSGLGGGAPPPPGGSPDESLLDRFARFLGWLLAVIAAVAAALVIVLTERRFPHVIRLVGRAR